MKKSYNYLILIVLLLFSDMLIAQFNREKLTITEEGVTNIVHANHMHLLALNPIKEYYSVYGSSIISQKGSTHGKVAHGKYYSYFRNKRIKSSGRFFRGLKTGKWTNWKDDGEISTIENYKKGLIHGKQEYWENGKRVAYSHYRKGILHGDSLSLSNEGDTLASLEFKKGKFSAPIKKPTKKKKFKKDKETKTRNKSEIFRKIKKADKKDKSLKEEKTGIFKKLFSKKEE